MFGACSLFSNATFFDIFEHFFVSDRIEAHLNQDKNIHMGSIFNFFFAGGCRKGFWMDFSHQILTDTIYTCRTAFFTFMEVM